MPELPSDRPSAFNKVLPYLLVAWFVFNLGGSSDSGSPSGAAPGSRAHSAPAAIPLTLFPSPPPAAAPTALPATTEPQRLLLADLVAAPAGSGPWIHTYGSVGILDLDAFVETHDLSPAGLTHVADLEQGWGFQFAARRTWLVFNGASFEVLLQHYATAQGAGNSYLAALDAEQPYYDRTGPVTAPNLPHSQIFVKGAVNGTGNASVGLVAQAGSTLIKIHSSNALTPNTDAVSGLALEQYRNLCTRVACDG